MAKDDNGAYSIVSADGAVHARQRRLLAYAFSDKALRQQEDLLLKYVDLMMTRLTEIAKSANPVANMVQWLDLATFDIVSDLSFGMSLVRGFALA